MGKEKYTRGDTGINSIIDHIAITEELRTGGAWLGAARTWMQSHIVGGDTLPWNSTKIVEVAFCDIEKFALTVAAAVEADRKKGK